jgi:hypothetical protein
MKPKTAKPKPPRVRPAHHSSAFDMGALTSAFMGGMIGNYAARLGQPPILAWKRSPIIAASFDHDYHLRLTGTAVETIKRWLDPAWWKARKDIHNAEKIPGFNDYPSSHVDYHRDGTVTAAKHYDVSSPYPRAMSKGFAHLSLYKFIKNLAYGKVGNRPQHAPVTHYAGRSIESCNWRDGDSSSWGANPITCLDCASFLRIKESYRVEPPERFSPASLAEYGKFSEPPAHDELVTKPLPYAKYTCVCGHRGIHHNVIPPYKCTACRCRQFSQLPAKKS